jgi:hypothetical protein
MLDSLERRLGLSALFAACQDCNVSSVVSELRCPACGALLRAFQTRLCCDACNGIMLEVVDFSSSIEQLTRVEPVVHFTREHAGHRKCPRCAATMSRCHLDVAVLDYRPRLKPELDHCEVHGIWFDAEQLAKVYETLNRAISPHMGGDGMPRNLIGRFNP